MDHEYENGRRYHGYEAGRYSLPNDERENVRLNTQHLIWLTTLDGKLHSVPLPSDITNAIDVGTGSGIWAMDFAKQHPTSNVIATDLSRVEASDCPSNCHFVVADAEKDADWTFPPMDFIHSRFLTPGFRNWPAYMGRCLSTLKPGGMLEFQEVEFPVVCDDGSCSADDPIIRWSSLCAEGTRKVNIVPDAQKFFAQQLKEAGFVNIVKEEYRWPIGPWTEDERLNKIGVAMMANTEELLNSTSAVFVRLLGWTKEQVDAFVTECKESIEDSRRHRYMLVTVHYAQKPLEDAETA